jgi:hypothetical protein
MYLNVIYKIMYSIKSAKKARIAMILIWLFTAGFAEPTGFRGIPWGAPIETVRKVYPKLQRQRDLQELPYYSVKGVKIATINDVELIFRFVNGGMEFVSISFQNAITYVQSMKDALVAEYGTPTERKLDGTLQWTGKAVAIVFWESPTTYTAHVDTYTPKHIGALVEFNRKKGDAVRKDLFGGTTRGADLTTKRCIEYIRDVPRPINLLDDTAPYRAVDTFYIYVRKDWYKLRPEHKKGITLYFACGNQLVVPGAITEIQDAQTKKKLASYGQQGFVEYEK